MRTTRPHPTQKEEPSPPGRIGGKPKLRPAVIVFSSISGWTQFRVPLLEWADWTTTLTVLRSEVVDGWQRVTVDLSASTRFFRLARP